MLPVAAIVQSVSNVVVPCLPLLITGAEKVTDGAIAKIGEEVWDLAKALWQKLWANAKDDPAVELATKKLAAEPESPVWQPAFQAALTDLLTQDTALAKALSAIIDESSVDADKVTIKQTVIGNQNQVIGQMTGGTVIGNQHKPQS
ncbi:MAG: hypothetical protein ACFB2W_27655 [Leptolyngbyaceae cyanobacterium]